MLLIGAIGVSCYSLGQFEVSCYSLITVSADGALTSPQCLRVKVTVSVRHCVGCTHGMVEQIVALWSRCKFPCVMADNSRNEKFLQVRLISFLILKKRRDQKRKEI